MVLFHRDQKVLDRFEHVLTTQTVRNPIQSNEVKIGRTLRLRLIYLGGLERLSWLPFAFDAADVGSVPRRGAVAES